jgi:hypothetical protein
MLLARPEPVDREWHGVNPKLTPGRNSSLSRRGLHYGLRLLHLEERPQQSVELSISVDI